MLSVQYIFWKFLKSVAVSTINNNVTWKIPPTDVLRSQIVFTREL